VFSHGAINGVTMRFDLHVHTAISPCSNLRIEDILGHARGRGLDGVCITDHGTMEIRRHVKEGFQEDGLCILFGMEYSTPDGDFLMFGPFEDFPTGLDTRTILKLVEQNGGAVVAAHPFRSGRSICEKIVSEGHCRIVESINGRNTEKENANVGIWRRRFRLNECGGSDAHSLDELGKVVTCFDVSVRSREDLVMALVKGLCRPEWNIPQYNHIDSSSMDKELLEESFPLGTLF
jgi:predicted metal-dependent phosphoesterase TrpH